MKLESGLNRIVGAAARAELEAIAELHSLRPDSDRAAASASPGAAATPPHGSGIVRMGTMAQVERGGSLGHAELDRWLAKDAANRCLLEFSDTDAFLQASIPSIWDPVSAHGEDVLSYFTDANVFEDTNVGGMSAVLGVNTDDHIHQLYDYSCSDSEVDDSDTVSSSPDDFVDLAASFLVESDASGAPVEDTKQENAPELPVERPRNRRKRELTLESAQDTPVRVVRPFKGQRMVGPIINIYDDALHSASCTEYFSSDPVLEVMNNAGGENYASQWNHDNNFLTPSYSGALDGSCNDEEVESPRSDAAAGISKDSSTQAHDSPVCKVELHQAEMNEQSSCLRVC